MFVFRVCNRVASLRQKSILPQNEGGQTPDFGHLMSRLSSDIPASVASKYQAGRRPRPDQVSAGFSGWRYLGGNAGFAAFTSRPVSSERVKPRSRAVASRVAKASLRLRASKDVIALSTRFWRSLRSARDYSSRSISAILIPLNTALWAYNLSTTYAPEG